MTVDPITPGQRRRVENLIRDIASPVIDELDLDKDSAQFIISNGDEVRAALKAALTEAGRMRYRSEEVASKRGYTLNVKPIAEQLLTLMKYFPGLDPGQALTCSKSLGDLPEGAEGWFVIPKPDKVAKTYGEALEVALKHLATQRGGDGAFKKWRERNKEKLGPKYLRLTEKTQKALEALSAQQSGDFLIIPAQFGIRHRGRSTRRAREVFAAKEYGLGPFEAAVMLLTHPERLQRYEDLCIDCSGAEYDYNADGSFDDAPFFRFYDVELHFYSRSVALYSDLIGPASAFLV